MSAPLSVVHFTDPGCPWAYSATPDLAVLHWRYGTQLAWRHVMIGLAETPERYLASGYTPAGTASGYRKFRRYGMPFSTAPKARVSATSPACRALVAVRLSAPEREWEALRALQFAQFTATALMDEPDDLRAALSRVDGVDADAILASIDRDDVWAAYEADRAETRTAARGATAFQGKAANTDGQERYTAPTLVFTAGDGRSLEAGGFQSIEAYDVCVANMDRTLERRAPATDALEVLAAFAFGLTTREVAAVMAPPMTAADDAAAEAALITATAAGTVVRESLGDGALWRLA